MAESLTALDLSRLCFTAVGPARIAACALTILAEENPNSSELEARYATSTNRIRIATEMLETTFPARLAKTGHRASAALDAARNAALDALAPLANATDGPLANLEQAMGGRAAFREHFFASVEPQITAFLELMSVELSQADAKRRAQHRTRTLTSIDSASGVGRAISMIAVNASIEASRSGDQGFRVIAEEIKQLATKTQKILGEVGEALRDT